MLQDIFPKRLRNEFDHSAVIGAEDIVINFNNEDILCDTESVIDFPRYKDLSTFVPASKFIYIFSIDEVRYFLLADEKVDVDKDAGSYRYIPFRDLRGIIIEPKYQLYAVYTAKHLRDWYRDNKFCGRCGKIMKHSDTERCMVCECGYHSYPRIMPAVIVGVTNGDKILLTKYRTGYGHNALVAGFVEIGETVEETVAREVMEETGLRVKNIRYYKSQPWGVANDILLGYYCDVDGDPKIKMDENELKYAAWVDAPDIELQPDDISLTNEMMKIFKAGERR